MATDTKINLCYPCGFFRPGDPEDPIAGDFQDIDGAIWPKTARVFWDKLRMLDNETLCARSGGALTREGLIEITSLNEKWLVDTKDATVVKVNRQDMETGTEWDRQLPFLVLVYLVSACDEPVGYEMVLPRDLFKGFDLFRNALDIDMHGVVKAFGQDGEGFLRAAKRLGGNRIKGGDVAVRFLVFPKFPVDYILWLGDAEFPASLTILVDRNTPQHLSADAIGVAVSLLSRRLCGQALPAPSSG
jgi:hypothetical protein